MGEVGSPPARARDFALLGVEHRIDLLDQGTDLDRHGVGQPTAPARSDVGDTATQGSERPKTKGDLNRSRRCKHNAQQRQRSGKILGEGHGGGRYAGEIRRDGDAHRHSAISDCKGDLPLGNRDPRIGRTSGLEAMDFAGRRLVAGQRQRAVPQGARSQELAAIVADLAA